jgi:hypothetical protein
MSQIKQGSNVPSEVLQFAEEHGGWFTSEDVCKELDIESRVVTAKFLRKLWKYDFLERRKKFESVELEYKIK